MRTSNVSQELMQGGLPAHRAFDVIYIYCFFFFFFLRLLQAFFMLARDIMSRLNRKMVGDRLQCSHRPQFEVAKVIALWEVRPNSLNIKSESQPSNSYSF